MVGTSNCCPLRPMSLKDASVSMVEVELLQQLRQIMAQFKSTIDPAVWVKHVEEDFRSDASAGHQSDLELSFWNPPCMGEG